MNFYNLEFYLKELEKENLVREAFIPDMEEKVKYLTYNSKDIEKNSLFVCKGAAFKQEYLEMAVNEGIMAYVSEKKYDLNKEIPYIIVSDIRKAMPILAFRYYNNPAENFKLVGITGTKGKSTTTYYVKYIFDEYLKSQGKNQSAVISGIDVYDGVINEESHLTTPESMDLFKHFKNVKDTGIELLEMEVSSQALKYNRVDKVMFDVGIYLNISEDHISPIEHPDFEDYYKSKLKIFEHSKNAVVNLDADFSESALEAAKVSPNIITFSLKNPKADIYGYDVVKEENDILFKVRTAKFDKQFKLTMPGLFNVENALAAIAAAYILEIPEEFIYKGLEKARSSGRMEVYSSKDKTIIAIVDYAHNKLSFEKLFESTVKEYAGREIVSVFGCPGKKALLRRRDLGTIAGKYSQKVYICAEDPGYEPVEDISKEIAGYVEAQNCDYVIIEDRGEAIKAAINEANPNTVILITGKGNETRQKYGSEYIPCPSDVEYTVKYLKEYDER